MDKIFEASFGGCIGNEMYIRVNAENAELNGFKLGVVDNASRPGSYALHLQCALV